MRGDIPEAFVQLSLAVLLGQGVAVAVGLRLADVVEVHHSPQGEEGCRGDGDEEARGNDDQADVGVAALERTSGFSIGGTGCGAWPSVGVLMRQCLLEVGVVQGQQGPAPQQPEEQVQPDAADGDQGREVEQPEGVLAVVDVSRLNPPKMSTKRITSRRPATPRRVRGFCLVSRDNRSKNGTTKWNTKLSTNGTFQAP